MKRGRIACLFLALVLCIGVFPVQVFAAVSGQAVVAYEETQFTSGSFSYDYPYDYDANYNRIVNKKELQVVGYVGSGSKATIPASVAGKPVTSIDYGAFMDDWRLSEIVIPGSVKIIHNRAFFNCTSLTKVTMGNGVSEIGNEVFQGCSKLTEIKIPASVTNLGNNAFAETPWLANQPAGVVYINNIACAYSGTAKGTLTIKTDTKAIAGSAFYGQKQLTSVSIPNSVKKIGESAFLGCSGLTKVTIGTGVSVIEGGAFSECTKLAEIRIPGNVKEIQNGYGSEGAFSECTALKKVTLVNGIEKIANHTFSGCKNLIELSIPGSVKCVGDLGNGNSLKKIVLGNGVAEINRWAFSYYENLSEIVIPTSVQTIGMGAFEATKWLKNQPAGVVYVNKIACASNGTMKGALSLKADTKAISGGAFLDQEQLTSVTFPNSIKEIPELAFAGCSGLTNVTIGKGVVTIGGGAFFDCTKLTEIVIPGNVKRLLPYQVSGAFTRCTALKKVTIEEGVTEIGWKAFFGCTQLKEVVIPSSVTSIDAWAFGYDGGFEPTPFTIKGYRSTAAESYVKWEKETMENSVVKFSALTPKNMTSTKFNRSSSTLGVKETFSLSLIATPTNATYRYNHYFTFSSSDKTVATVNSTGKVTALKAGTAKITATSKIDGKIVATCTVTVKPAPTSITLNKKSATIGVGEKTLKLTSAVNSGAASMKRTYSSSNTAVATVDQSGVVTGKKVGTATITVTSFNGRKSNCTVTVKAAPSSITISKKSASIGVGEKTLKLTSAVNSGAASLKRSYSSSNAAVATVDQSGVVTGKKAGTATISVTSFNGRKSNCTVTVKAAPSSIKLDCTSKTLSKGGKLSLHSSVNSGAASNQRTFTSSNTKVAIVDRNGLVTAKAVGTATITVTTFNRRTATCKITVK